METPALIKKIPQKDLKKIYTFDIESAKQSIKKPGITDKELPKGDKNKKPFIVVFRHGQSEDNIQRIHSGWRDPKLTEVGIKDAKALTPKLKDIKFNYYFCSDQTRSIETLKYAMGKRDYKPIIEWRVKERNYGDLAGKSKVETIKSNPLMGVLYRRSFECPPPNGESLLMVYYRVLPFLKELKYVLKKEKASAVISCSGNSMRAIRTYFEDLTPEQTVKLENPTGKDYCLYNI